MKYQEILDRAEKCGACKEALEALRLYKSLDEALESPNASYWAYWYAYNVLKAPFPEAEEAIS